MEPDDVVVAYLRDRRHWELTAQRQYTHGRQSGRLIEALDQIGATYRKLLEAYGGTPFEAVQGSVFGDPPSVDPATTRIVSVERIGPAGALVKTSEDGAGPEPTEYEYELELLDDRWLLRDRRGKDLRGRWVGGLL